MACTWFGVVPSCCSLTALLGPVWVLLNYVLQTIFSGPVHMLACFNTVTVTKYVTETNLNIISMVYRAPLIGGPQVV